MPASKEPKRPADSKTLSTELVPSDPITLRTAVLQVSLLVGIPLALLLLIRFILRQFFPSLGY